MLRLTETVYLAAPFERPEHRALNLQLTELARAYNFPMFLPQEALEEVEAELAGQGREAIDQRFNELCLDKLSYANLVLAVYYGDEFDPLTAFEVGYATGRWINVVAIRNELDPALCRPSEGQRAPSPLSCARIVSVPEDSERLVDRLIPTMNRFFVPHKPL